MARMKTKTTFLATVALMLMTTGVALAGLPEFKEGDFSSHIPDADRGKVLYSAAGCATCHSIEGDMMTLAGGRGFENRLGTVYAPNITHDQTAGIGNWSDAQFLNALLRGVAPNGRQYYGVFFPYAAYARMKPEDALDIRAYLKTMQSSDLPSKSHAVNLLSDKALQLMNSERAALSNPTDPQLARGEYLVEALGHCGECHSPRDGFSIDTTKAYSGFLGYFGDYSPDISGPRLEKAGAVAFVNGVLAEGKKLNGRPLGAGAMRRVAEQTAKLSLDDRAAIYAFLTGKPLDVSTLPQAAPELVQVAEVAEAGSATVTDATAGPAPMDMMELARETGSQGLMQIVQAACAMPVDSPVLQAVAAPARVAAVAGVPIEIETAADRVMDQHCRTCHGPGQRNDRTFPMHDIADMAMDKATVTPGDPDKSPVYASIALNRMPLGTKLTPAELDAIKAWIVALGEVKAAPPAAVTPVASAEPVAVNPARPNPDVTVPRFVGGDFTQIMMAGVADLQRLNDRDRRFARYFSFADTELPELDCTAEGMKRNPMAFLHAGLNKFINSISRAARLAKVTPVDGTDGALVRIDIRDYGWSEDDWAAISTGLYTQGAVEAGFSPESWADLARVYPYAMDPTSDSLLRVLADSTGAPVPLLGASWFTHVASEAPYYDMFLRLPEDIRILEQRMGVDVDRNIQSGEVIRAGMLEGASGVSDHNRMLERHDLPRGGYYWKSYDFAGSSGEQSLLQHPDGPRELSYTASGTAAFEHDGGEMIFSLANGLQGYYLSTNLGERLLVGPTSIVSFRNKPIGKGVEIENARSCFDCHENGMIRKADQVRKFIESSNSYTRDQREILLEMYVPNEELDQWYQQDTKAFLAALEELGITEKSAAGVNVSMRAPEKAGGGEIVTYLSDIQFNNLDLAQVARTFFLTEDEFRARIREVGDPNIMQVVQQWVQRVDDGLHVRRAELEAVYADLLPRLTDLRPYDYGGGVSYTPQPVADYVAVA
ncbi:cytochrome c, partial [Pseudotabrizicola sp.]|uniref:c-type cytochrome n=1 Tax=Pseudotabrizicola sp. TaxID=2939647 RepID=UPI0027219370